jgi:hypothetical protein
MALKLIERGIRHDYAASATSQLDDRVGSRLVDLKSAGRDPLENNVIAFRRAVVSDRGERSWQISSPEVEDVSACASVQLV